MQTTIRSACVLPLSPARPDLGLQLKMPPLSDIKAKGANRSLSSGYDSAMAGLEKVCIVQLDLAAEGQDVGETPIGLRRVLEIVGGTVQGDRLAGVVLAGGGDWLLLGADGWGRLDVRMQWRMDDGPVIYVRAQGVVDFNERVLQAREAGESTAFEDQYYRTLMQMEAANDGPYAWVNRAVFITEGRISPGDTRRGVEFCAYKVV
jgi:hypothetical protein